MNQYHSYPCQIRTVDVGCRRRDDLSVLLDAKAFIAFSVDQQPPIFCRLIPGRSGNALKSYNRVQIIFPDFSHSDYGCSRHLPSQYCHCRANSRRGALVLSISQPAHIAVSPTSSRNGTSLLLPAQRQAGAARIEGGYHSISGGRNHDQSPRCQAREPIVQIGRNLC